MTRILQRISLPFAALLVAVGLVTAVGAQDKPRSGGELVFVVPAEPPTYDGHREGTFALVHPAAPHCSCAWTRRAARGPRSSAISRNRGGGRDTRSLHDRVSPQVAVGVVPEPARLAVQLDLQGRHPRKDQKWFEKNVMGTGPFTSWSTSAARIGSARRTRATVTSASTIWAGSFPAPSTARTGCRSASSSSSAGPACRSRSSRPTW